ncbi:FxDxF family PEP-CTERM protein [Hoeflea sp.]|uniref:FxDxF family PEP-CTERM protein n=1 Tax=Hoeflea sp. TaxID=1940281 RepID=UPI0019CB4B04|nr:FxDxF family PEP-CTERM protein [Hoeflea sp.]MBC7285379.1 PEP-CTERM sorting domain-containing protein [Hoeflea sp.]
MRTIAKLMAATAVMAFAPAVQAADIYVDNTTAVPGAYFDVSGNIASGPISALYGRTGIGVGTFTDRFLFTIDQIGLGSGGISTILAGGLGTETDLDFTEVTFFNGTDTVPVTITNTGFFESGGLANVPIAFGVQNVLSVTYLSRGAGAYSGNLSFSPSAVPEPASWAMMLLGFGAVGSIVRRRRNQTVRVSYA